jgi:multimeric flavodoxin WrbA
MTAKKVLVALGSPRKQANSTILAERAADGAREAGGEVESFFLHGMDIKLCDACDACKKKSDRGCHIKDDMQLLYPKIREADVLIIASPVYWLTFSSQIKVFMDRWYGLWNGPDNTYQGTPFRDKRIGIILTGGGKDPWESGAVNAIRTFQDTFTYLGCPPIRTLYGAASDTGEVSGNEDLLAGAFRMGRRLAGG